MALSPPPGPIGQPPSTSLPAMAGSATSPVSVGPSTRGSTMPAISSSPRPSAIASRSRRYSLAVASKYAVPEASERSVNSASRFAFISSAVASSPRGPWPAMRQLSQSCGRQIAAMRAAFSGSFAATHATLVIVNEATSEEPTALTQRWRPRIAGSSDRSSSLPSAAFSASPRQAMSTSAFVAERVSFHSSASRITRPWSSSSTMPCCWPPTASAATSSSPPACSAASWNACH